MRYTVSVREDSRINPVIAGGGRYFYRNQAQTITSDDPALDALKACPHLEVKQVRARRIPAKVEDES